MPLLDWLNAHSELVVGGIAWTGFLALVAGLFYWGRVAAPGMGRAILEGLPGYVADDLASPEIGRSLQDLMPFSTVRSMADEFATFAPVVLVAVRRDEAGICRRVVAVQRTLRASGRRSRTSWETVVLERRPLPVAGDVYIRPRVAAEARVLEMDAAVIGAEPVSDGLSPEFSRLFQVFTVGGHAIPVPGALQDACVELEPCLSRAGTAPQRLFDVNLRVTPRGFGICSPEIWLSRELTHVLSAAAERISTSLSA